MTPDDVRDLFDRALAARREIRRMRHRLEALKSPTMSAGIPQAVHGGMSDPTASAASALVDEEGEMRQMERSCLAVIDEAREIVRGVLKGLGVSYANVLDDHYIRDLSWDAVAALNGISKSSALRYRDVAFDWIATVGVVRAKSGEGGDAAAEAEFMGRTVDRLDMPDTD